MSGLENLTAEQIERLPDEQKQELLELLERRKKLLDIEQSQEHFIPFVNKMWPQFIAGHHHKIMADAFERIKEGKLRRLIISMPPRHALAVDTPIPTTAGFKRMDEIVPGDYVFGPDGKPTEVIGCSEIFRNREVWRVSTDDGASVVADADHLWNVRLSQDRPVFKNKTTQFLYTRQETKKGARKPRLPEYQAVELPAREFVTDPYTLGVWLGDGTATGATITKNDEDAEHLKKRISAAGYTVSVRKTPITFGVLGLQRELKDLGVFANKHIPPEYLLGSVPQRVALLQGLMDTDGFVLKQGQSRFSTSSSRLCSDVLKLLRSLGIKASVTEMRATFQGKDYGTAYRIGFYYEQSCSLPRKKERARGYTKPIGRYLTLEREGLADTRCIKVAREDGLFLAGHGYMVNHNTKSEFGSWLLPAWYLGHFPDKKILHASHTADLTANFGRKIRDLIEEGVYKEVFPDTILKSDAKSSGKWQTTKGGQYYAAGVGGALAGRGADLAIIDDPISEQDLTDGAFDQCWEWFQAGPRQRLQPGGVIVIIMTRWSRKDLVGKLLARMEKDPLAERYEYIEFPALLYEEGKEGDDTKVLDSLWPEYWPLEDMLAVKRAIAPHLWSAQYMQKPTGKGASIIQQGAIRRWPSDAHMPEMEYIVHSYDPAFEQKESTDPTGFSIWGAFRPVGVIDGIRYDGSRMHFMCLNAIKRRMDFPELKRFAIGQWRAGKPDTVVIEKRASGLPLVQELWKAGLFVETFTPHRGTGDKAVRLNSVSSMFDEGLVWVPEGPMWADELVDDLYSFPNCEYDDLVDSTTMALLRFKRGNFVKFQTDVMEDDETVANRAMRRKRYYNV